jgi:hypothetical protein
VLAEGDAIAVLATRVSLLECAASMRANVNEEKLGAFVDATNREFSPCPGWSAKVTGDE